MQKIFNWTLGSFFRTIGRTIAFLVMGGLIYYLLSYNGIDLKNLFLDNVKASTYQNSNWFTYYDSSNNVLPNQFEYQYMTGNITTQNGDFTGSLFVLYNQSFNLSNLKGGYIVIPFFIEAPTMYNTTHNTIYGSDYCQRYQCTQWDSNNECLRFTCDYVNNSQDSTLDTRVYLPAQVEVSAILVYTNGYAESCSFSRDTMNITCNVSNNTFVGTIQDIRVFHKVYYNNSSVSSTYKFGLGQRVQYFGDSTNAIIDNQNSNTQSIINSQNQNHQELMDSNTTQADSQGQDFINNFSNNTHGLTGIITAPLNAIQGLASATCSPIVLPLPFTNNKTLTLPCMNTIYSSHFGVFYTMYQGIILALISYWVCIRIFTLVKGFKDPDDDKIEVVDL